MRSCRNGLRSRRNGLRSRRNGLDLALHELSAADRTGLSGIAGVAAGLLMISLSTAIGSAAVSQLIVRPSDCRISSHEMREVMNSVIEASISSSILLLDVSLSGIDRKPRLVSVLPTASACVGVAENSREQRGQRPDRRLVTRITSNRAFSRG